MFWLLFVWVICIACFALGALWAGGRRDVYIAELEELIRRLNPLSGGV
jgi:hypothetical protein